MEVCEIPSAPDSIMKLVKGYSYIYQTNTIVFNLIHKFDCLSPLLTDVAYLCMLFIIQLDMLRTTNTVKSDNFDSNGKIL